MNEGQKGILAVTDRKLQGPQIRYLETLRPALLWVFTHPTPLLDTGEIVVSGILCGILSRPARLQIRDISSAYFAS
jgi:hypothetical protein